MNKICTDIKQSQKLIELGIDANTADMYHHYDEDFSEFDLAQIIDDGEDSFNTHHALFPDDIPAWSFGALLKILSDITDYSFELVFLKRTTDGRGDILENVYRCSVDMKDVWNTEPLDAVYNMIMLLKENGKI